MTQVNHLVQSGAEKVVSRHLFLSNSLRFQRFRSIFLRVLGSLFGLEFTHSCGVERFCRSDYKGRAIADLPGHYLNWFAREGFPPGELGRLLALIHEIDHNGLKELLAPLRKAHR